MTKELIKILCCLAVLFSCQTQDKGPSKGEAKILQELFPSQQLATIEIDEKTRFPVILSITGDEQSKGLSSIASKDFPTMAGMLFVNSSEGPRNFWMPDTYFNLHIIFLNRNFKVVHVARDMQAHPGRDTPPEIEKTPPILAQYVLEVRSDSPLAQMFEPGQEIKLLKFQEN